MSAFPESKPSPRIAYVVTVDQSVKLIEGQIAFLARNGFEVDVICSPGQRLEAMRQTVVTPWPIEMKREIAVTGDVIALWRLWRLFRRLRPEIVVAGTPKAGLLGTVAARLAGTPNVQYMLHGLRFETAAGMKRRVLLSAEWIACHVADSIRCVSESLLRRVVALRLAPADRCMVIGPGTSEGINVERFAAAAQADRGGKQMRGELRIPAHAAVIGFVGRMTRDKGIGELYEAFTRLRVRYIGLRLLIVGEFEDGDPISDPLRAQIETDPDVIRTGFVDDVERFYPAMDVMALPTYREGFPIAPLESQAAGVPVVTTDATGAMDAIVGGKTGLRIPAGNVDALTSALERLLSDPGLRGEMGLAGCVWVQKNFRAEDLRRKILACYSSLLTTSRGYVPSRLQDGDHRIFDVQERM